MFQTIKGGPLCSSHSSVNYSLSAMSEPLTSEYFYVLLVFFLTDRSDPLHTFLALELYVLDKQSAMYARAPRSDLDYSDLSDPWEKDSSVESSRCDVSELEANHYYFCMRGPRRWGPEFIIRMSKDVFTAPSKPEPRLVRLLPVYEHHLGKDDLWATIRSKVRDLLEVQQSAD
jgi:hypothetical protein